MRLASFTLLFLLPFLVHAQSATDNLQSIRYLAFSAGSHLLLYYHPYQTAHDPRPAERYHQDLERLQRLATLNGGPAITQRSEQLVKRIEELEAQPDGEAELRPMWINKVLQAQADLDQAIESLHMQRDTENAAGSAADRLSLDVQRLLLLYQTATFGSIGVFIDELKAGSPAPLDRRIMQGFSELAATQPQDADEIARLRRMYAFVRPRLLKYDLRAVPNVAAYYLAQVGDGLAQLNREQPAVR